MNSEPWISNLAGNLPALGLVFSKTANTPMSVASRLKVSFYFLFLTRQVQPGSQVVPHCPVPLRYHDHLCLLSCHLSHSVFLFIAYESF